MLFLGNDIFSRNTFKDSLLHFHCLEVEVWPISYNIDDFGLISE